MTASPGTVSVLLSAFDFGTPVESARERIGRIAPQGTDVVVVAPRGCRAEALNRNVDASRGEWLLFVPSFVDVHPALIPAYVACLQRVPAAAMAYGDYTIRTRAGEVVRREVCAHEANLSEWSSVGYVTGVRRSAFERVGGYDPAFRVAEEYDLRLRLSRDFRLARVGEPLYELDAGSVPLEDERVRDALATFFTREASPRQGGAYLWQRPAVREEVERAFAAEARARGAWLEGATQSLDCPHAACRPTVSVVIPVLDRAALLQRAVESVLEGSFRDLEILIVDGGSTDGTREVAAGFARTAPVKLLPNPSCGVTAALNAGLRAARGRYVSQLDSDDEYVPATLERMVDYLDTNPECALGISYYEIVDAEGRPLPGLEPIKHLEYDRNAILRTDGAGAVRTWHRCVLERLGGFDEARFDSYAEDYDLVLRLSERYAVGRVHDVLYRCRRHAANSDARLGVELRAEKKSLARALALQRRIALNTGVAGGEAARLPGLAQSSPPGP